MPGQVHVSSWCHPSPAFQHLGSFQPWLVGSLDQAQSSLWSQSCLWISSRLQERIPCCTLLSYNFHADCKENWMWQFEELSSNQVLNTLSFFEDVGLHDSCLLPDCWTCSQEDHILDLKIPEFSFPLMIRQLWAKNLMYPLLPPQFLEVFQEL